MRANLVFHLHRFDDGNEISGSDVRSRLDRDSKHCALNRADQIGARRFHLRHRIQPALRFGAAFAGFGRRGRTRSVSKGPDRESASVDLDDLLVGLLGVTGSGDRAFPGGRNDLGMLIEIASGHATRNERRIVQHAAMKPDGAGNATDLEFVERASCAGQRFVAVPAVKHELGDERVIRWQNGRARPRRRNRCAPPVQAESAELRSFPASG